MSREAARAVWLEAMAGRAVEPAAGIRTRRRADNPTARAPAPLVASLPMTSLRHTTNPMRGTFAAHRPLAA